MNRQYQIHPFAWRCARPSNACIHTPTPPHSGIRQYGYRISFLLLLFAAAIRAQPAPDCNQMLHDGDALMARKNPPLEEALRNYLNALNCNSNLAAKVGPKVQAVLDSIKRQNERIVAAKALADRQKEEADALRLVAQQEKNAAQESLKRAERLNAFLRFGPNRAAWVFDDSLGKFALINRDGIRLTDYLYDNPAPFENGVALAQTNNLPVFLNDLGQEVSPRYHYAINLPEGRYLTGYNSDTTFVCDPSGRIQESIVHPAGWRENGLAVSSIVGGLARFLMSRTRDDEICMAPEPADWADHVVSNYGKTAEIDREQRVYTPGIATALEKLSNGMGKLNAFDKFALADRNGKAVTGFDYDYIADFSEGLVMVLQHGLGWGYLDSNGMRIIPCRYESAQPFTEGLAAVEDANNEFGYINPQGNWVIRPKYLDAHSFFRGKAVVESGNQAFFIDRKGNVSKKNRFVFIGTFTDGLARAQSKNSKWGFVDANGEWIISPKFDCAGDFSNGLAPVSLDGVQQYIDAKGNTAINTDFQLLRPFSQGLATVFKIPEEFQKVIREGVYHFSEFREICKKGLLDTAGNPIVPVECDEIYQNDSPYIVLRKGGTKSLIDHTGKVILPTLNYFRRYYAAPFGLIIQNSEGRYGILNPRGDTLLPMSYDGIYLNGKVALLSQNNRWGIWSPEHGVFLKPQYDAIGELGEEFGWIRVKKDDKWGWIDSTGATKIPLRYDSCQPFHSGRAFVGIKEYPEEFMINPKGELIR